MKKVTLATIVLLFVYAVSYIPFSIRGQYFIVEILEVEGKKKCREVWYPKYLKPLDSSTTPSAKVNPFFKLYYPMIFFDRTFAHQAKVYVIQD